MISGSLCVRPADPVEHGRVTAALFGRSARPTKADIIVATEPDGKKPVAVAALWFLPTQRFPERAVGVIHVSPSERRRGIGRALVNDIVKRAEKRGVARLFSRPIDNTSAAFQFLCANGFEVAEKTITYAVRLDRFASQECYDRLLARGKIPAVAQIIPLSSAPVEEVCKIILDTRAFASASVAQRLRRTEHGFSQTLSPVVMIDDRVVGATLVTYQKAVATIDAAAVAPQWRNTWIGVVMKNTVQTWLRNRGVLEMQFNANPVLHPDTAKYAKRAGARVLKTISTMCRNLQHPEQRLSPAMETEIALSVGDIVR